MRGLAILALVLAGTLPAQAQQPPRPAAPKPAATRPPAPKPLTAKETYARMSQPERVAIQSDLNWTGHYNGLADGDFNDRSVNAVKAFQAAIKNKQTGILNPRERELLARQARGRQEAVGWKLVEDAATGSRVGVPLKLVPQSAAGRNGTRWSAAQGQLQVESFRLRDTALPAALAQHKTEADRKIEYSVNRPDFFVIAGTQGSRKFYLRAHGVNGEVRGFVVLYDPDMARVVDPVVVAMSGSFTAASPAAQAAAVAARKRVEYGTGVVVSAEGHIVSDRALTDDCHVVTVPGYGNAERLAENEASGLALLRIYGARDLRPLPLKEAAAPDAVTLIGVPDPQAQNGGGAVKTVPARLAATRVEPAPAAGFAGAAVTDGRGGLVGVVARGAQAALADSVRAFLKAHDVEIDAEGAPGEGATTSVVRVVCVRK